MWVVYLTRGSYSSRLVVLLSAYPTEYQARSAARVMVGMRLDPYGSPGCEVGEVHDERAASCCHGNEDETWWDCHPLVSKRSDSDSDWLICVAEASPARPRRL